jgi:hypothetical protein
MQVPRPWLKQVVAQLIQYLLLVAQSAVAVAVGLHLWVKTSLVVGLPVAARA